MLPLFGLQISQLHFLKYHENMNVYTVINVVPETDEGQIYVLSCLSVRTRRIQSVTDKSTIKKTYEAVKFSCRLFPVSEALLNNNQFRVSTCIFLQRMWIVGVKKGRE